MTGQDKIDVAPAQGRVVTVRGAIVDVEFAERGRTRA
jgi:hypothetical protein